MIECQFNRQCHIAVMLWLVLCIAVGCVVPPSPVPPRPDPVPVVDDTTAVTAKCMATYHAAMQDALADLASDVKSGEIGDRNEFADEIEARTRKARVDSFTAFREHMDATLPQWSASDYERFCREAAVGFGGGK